MKTTKAVRPNRHPGLDPGSTFPSTNYEQLPEEGDEQERAAREWLRHIAGGE